MPSHCGPITLTNSAALLPMDTNISGIWFHAEGHVLTGDTRRAYYAVKQPSDYDDRGKA